MEMTPVVEVGPVIGVTISVAIAAAMEDRRGAKTAAAEDGCSAKAATVEGSPAASESAAVKCATARDDAAPKPTMASAAVEAAAAARTATTATMATMATASNFCRQAIGREFCRRGRAGTCKRERLGALLGCGRERKYGRSRNAQTADKAASRIGYRHR